MLEVRLNGQRGPLSLAMDVTIPDTGITGLFGPSASGKTTLLRWIAGLEDQLDGEVILNGKDITTLPARSRKIGMVFQHNTLFPHMSVADNLHFACNLNGTSLHEQQQLITLLELSTLLTQKPHQLSGGQQQRVALARALLAKPALLLLDEPLASLDLAGRDEVLSALELLHQEWQTPMLYVSHQPHEIQRLSDHLLLIEDGNIIASGPLQECLLNPSLPLIHLQDAASVIEGVIQMLPDESLRPEAEAESKTDSNSTHHSRLLFDGGELNLSGGQSRHQTNARVSILARDVSITLSAATDSSINNILPARIDNIVADNLGQSLVFLSMGNTTIAAKITQRSVNRLALKVGQAVFAQIKSVALLN